VGAVEKKLEEIGLKNYKLLGIKFFMDGVKVHV